MKILLGLLLSLYLGTSWGEIYKWVDGDGVVHYSDEPQGNVKPITLPEISIFKFRIPESKPKPTEATETEVPPLPELVDYRAFEIARPSNNESFSTLPARLDVEFALVPGLQRGHRIELSLDGNPVAGPILEAGTRLSDFAAGSHILSARILAADGRQLARSKSVLFHYQPGPSTPAGDWAPPSDAAAFPDAGLNQ